MKLAKRDIQGREKDNLYQDPGKIKVYENETGYAKHDINLVILMLKRVTYLIKDITF